jgi:hypothetical protein
MRPLFGYILSHRLPVNYQLVNRLISVNYSFRHVGTIRLTPAPHPLEILSHLHGISAHLHLKTQSDYAEQNSVEGSDNNVRNTLCGIVRHSTLWLKPEAVAQIAFLEWTGVDHLRHTKFVALRDDKDPKRIVRET